MGRLRAEEMIEFAGFELALQDHLRHGHYPPVDLVFLDTARNAISEAEAENWDEMLFLPNGKEVPVWQVVEELHLEPFMQGERDV